MGEYCELCGSERKLIEGVGKKSGKLFKGWFCSKKGCTSKPKFIKIDQEQPKEVATPVQDSQNPTVKPTISPVKEEKVDWDSKERRVVRESALRTIAIYRQNDAEKTFDDLIAEAQQLELWVYRTSDEPTEHNTSFIPHSEPVEVLGSNTTSTSAFSDLLKQFSKAKSLLSETDYYAVLLNYDIDHANEVKTIDQGNQILGELRTMYKVRNEGGKIKDKPKETRMDEALDGNEEF